MKNFFLFLISLFLFFLFVPLMFIVGILILIFDGRPVFFLQKRSGIRGKVFVMYKFRTMGNAKLKNDRLRVTSLGKILRTFKIDELPQLLNILKGDIRLVGPRPLYPEYNKFYNNKQKKRLSIKPGITGWAQINEKKNTSWKKRLDLDIWYVENQSFFLDIKIIFKTFLLIIKMIYKKNNRVSLITKRFDEK